MFIIFTNLSAQHKIYKFNNDCLNVFIDSEDEYSVFYKTDTISSSKLKHISKHHIALIIDKNGELKLFNPKYTFRINTELALLINDARSGFSGSENKKRPSYYLFRKNPQFMPGLYFGANMVFGNRRFLKYFLNVNFSLVHSKFNYYNYDSYYPRDRNNRRAQIINSNIELITLYDNVNLGLNLRIYKNLVLDFGPGFNLPLNLISKENGTMTIYDYKNDVLVSEEIVPIKHNDYSKLSPEISPTLSSMMKLTYIVPKQNNKFGIFMGSNFHFKATNVPNYFYAGITYFNN